MASTATRSNPTNYRIAVGSLVLVSLTLLSTTKREEGERLKPYYDTVGVFTVCVGSTTNVEKRIYTQEECNARTLIDVTRHGKGAIACIKVPIAQTEYEAFADLAFNIGIGAFCRSTLVKLLNEGNYFGACNQILKWVKQRELTARRKRAHALCLTPVDTLKEIPDVRHIETVKPVGVVGTIDNSIAAV